MVVLHTCNDTKAMMFLFRRRHSGLLEESITFWLYHSNGITMIDCYSAAFYIVYCLLLQPLLRLYCLACLSVPISTYVLGPTKASHLRYYDDKDGCDLCENVTYLGMSTA